MNIAFIPARGGSKRIPGKNLKLFCGRPLIIYALEAIQNSGVFDQVIISSDSKEILDFGRNIGVQVLERKSKLADDFTTISDVVKDFITQHGFQLSDSVCCVLPSNPFISSLDLIEAHNLHPRWEYIYTVIESQKPIERVLRRLEDGTTRILNPEFLDLRTQDLPKSYFDAGQFYYATVKSWISGSSILNSQSLGLPCHLKNSVDIDTMDDWKVAEALFGINIGERE